MNTVNYCLQRKRLLLEQRKLLYEKKVIAKMLKDNEKELKGIDTYLIVED